MTEQTMSSRNATMLALFVVGVVVGGVYLDVNLINERVADAEYYADSLEKWAEIDSKNIKRLREDILEMEVYAEKTQQVMFPPIQLGENQTFLELKDLIRNNVQLRIDLKLGAKTIRNKNQEIENLKAVITEGHQAHEDAYMELWKEHRELISLVVEAGVSPHNCTVMQEVDISSITIEFVNGDN